MESKDAITEKSTWSTYWESYNPNKVLFKNQFTTLFSKVKNGDNKLEFLEIGGFPGTFSIYFKKYKQYNITLLDYFISHDVINKLLKINNLNYNDLEIIESDFFNYKTDKKYDLVFSSGFIEHFEDTKNVLIKHNNLLKEKGELLITLPNLKGLNGWVQKRFDLKNYTIHNVKCMDIELLKSICVELNLKDLEVYYYGKPMVWLESTANVSPITRTCIRLLSFIIKLFPIQGKFLSPYIVLRGTR